MMNLVDFLDNKREWCNGNIGDFQSLVESSNLSSRSSYHDIIIFLFRKTGSFEKAIQIYEESASMVTSSLLRSGV